MNTENFHFGGKFSPSSPAFPRRTPRAVKWSLVGVSLPRLLSLVCGAVAVRCLADRGRDPPIDRARRRRRGSLPPASRRSPQPPTGFDVETRYCPFRSPPADLLCKSRRYAGGDVEAVLMLKVSFPLPSPLSPPSSVPPCSVLLLPLPLPDGVMPVGSPLESTTERQERKGSGSRQRGKRWIETYRERRKRRPERCSSDCSAD